MNGMFADCAFLTTLPDINIVETEGTDPFSSLYRNCKRVKKPPKIFLASTTNYSILNSAFNGSGIKYGPECDFTFNTGYTFSTAFMNCSEMVTGPRIFSNGSEPNINRIFLSAFEGCTKLRWLWLDFDKPIDNYSYSYEKWMDGVPSDWGVLVTRRAFTKRGAGKAVPSGWDVVCLEDVGFVAKTACGAENLTARFRCTLGEGVESATVYWSDG